LKRLFEYASLISDGRSIIHNSSFCKVFLVCGRDFGKKSKKQTLPAPYAGRGILTSETLAAEWLWRIARAQWRRKQEETMYAGDGLMTRQEAMIRRAYGMKDEGEGCRIGC
jgi:hypothetical protein